MFTIQKASPDAPALIRYAVISDAHYLRFHATNKAQARAVCAGLNSMGERAHEQVFLVRDSRASIGVMKMSRAEFFVHFQTVLRYQETPYALLDDRFNTLVDTHSAFAPCEETRNNILAQIDVLRQDVGAPPEVLPFDDSHCASASDDDDDDDDPDLEYEYDLFERLCVLESERDDWIALMSDMLRLPAILVDSPRAARTFYTGAIN